MVGNVSVECDGEEGFASLGFLRQCESGACTSHPAASERNVGQLCANGGARGAFWAHVSLALASNMTEYRPRRSGCAMKHVNTTIRRVMSQTRRTQCCGVALIRAAEMTSIVRQCILRASLHGRAQSGRISETEAVCYASR